MTDISRRGGMNSTAEDWSDFVHQTERVYVQIPASSLDGNENPKMEPAYELDPAGGLARDEVAELVHAEFNLSTNVKNAGTLDGNIEAKWQVTFGDQAPMHYGPDGNFTETFDGESIDVKVMESTDPDLVFYRRQRAFQQVVDPAAGVGAGGTFPNETVQYSLRDMYGQGPLAGSRDSLNFFLNWDNDGIQNQDVNSCCSVNLAWEIHELDDVVSR